MTSALSLSRRALLATAGTAVASAALTAPYVNAAHADEDVTARLERLTQELSAVLAEHEGGRYAITVEPGTDGDVTFVAMAAEERRAHHLAEFKRASQEVDPSISYWLDIAPAESTAGCGGGTVACRRTGQYAGDGTYESGEETALGRKSRWQVELLLSPKDGQRSFLVSCPGQRMFLTEDRLNAFIGRKVA
jgi:protein involved in temperature-dependent protein secretion